MEVEDSQPKVLRWVGSSKRDLLALPRDVYRQFGQGLGLVQLGGLPLQAKALQGFGGANVMELREDDRAGTYRAVYTVRFAGAIYVLHVFTKKSKKGIATDQQDIDLIKLRLKDAEAHYARHGKSGDKHP